MPTLTKQDAFNQANARARSGASVADVLADAEKILAFVNGGGCATATPAKVAAPVLKSDPRKKPKIVYYAEYSNKYSTGTHLGNKAYDTYSGAAKNGSSRRGTLARRFIRVVQLKEVL